MKNFIKLFLIFMIAILTIIAIPLPCAAARLQEKGFESADAIKDGKIVAIKILIDSANGGPATRYLKVERPESTILKATVSLAVKNGSYKIELLENNKPSLTLTAKGGKRVTGSGSMTVNADGRIQYRVTAKKAKGVVINFSFTLLRVAPGAGVGKQIVQRPEEKVSIEQATENESLLSKEIKLSLTCLPGKNCRVTAQNKSRTKAYRNIAFEITFSTMVAGEEAEKIKVGTVDAAVLPDKTDEWAIGLTFTENPKDLAIRLVNADAIEPSAAAQYIQMKKKSQMKAALAKAKEVEKIESPAAASPATVSIPANAATANPSAPPAAEPIALSDAPAKKDVVSLHFFESGYDSVTQKRRIYKDEFAASDTRFINWELSMQHPAPGKMVEYELEAVWRKADGTIITRPTQSTLIEPEWKNPFVTGSWGNSDAGKFWQPGIYQVDIYIGGEKVAGGSFKVY
jgi:hypothetical protein